ncbi:MAG: hydrogenase maturation protease [Candidatus Omnitrophica bacterium]|nr:hydrogenase maturation protease [Candidatus Omnitrophota bacterium]
MKYLAFDLGGVLFDFDYNIALKKIKKDLSVSVDTVIDAFFKKDFTLDYEMGIVTDYEFYTKFKTNFAPTLTYQEFIDVWCDIFIPKEKIIDLVERLHYIHKIILISNINRLHFEFLYKKYPKVFSFFSDLILSYKLKSIKPQRRIYEELQKRFNVSFADIIYIDDRVDLMPYAKQLGLNCIQFQNYEQLLSLLDYYNVKIIDEHKKNIFRKLKNTLSKYKNCLLVGIGNKLRGDDAIGIEIAEALKNKISFDILNAEVVIENYLHKLCEGGYDLILFIDAANIDQDIEIFNIDEIPNNLLTFTHNSAFKLIANYLKNFSKCDILLLALKIEYTAINEGLSKESEQLKNVIVDFFIKNFPQQESQWVLEEN